MRNCKQCKSEFEIQVPKFYDKLKLTLPTLCPVCRRQRRLAFWPYGILQKRKCDFSGEDIISTYSPDAHFPVFRKKYWFGDDWNPPEMEIDWNKSFFEQLYELQSKTPHFHQLGKNNTNCDYADDVWSCKNAYLSRSMLECEDVMYIYRVLYSKDCMDLTYCYNMDQSYECTYCFKCYNLKFSLDCRDCSDSYFLYSCSGCRDCFMCWNLRNRKYCIFNKQYSEEEYKEKIKSLHLNSRAFLNELRKRFVDHIKNDAIHKADHNLNTENCDGNYITDCRNCHDAYFMEDAENDVHVYRSPKTNNCVDCTGLLNGELSYEVCQCTDCNNIRFALFCSDCSDSAYIDQCFNCIHCFGCVGLKRKKFCILNKQYSKEEYAKIMPKLKEKMIKDGEYGEFFPYKFAFNGFNLSLGSFFYNETESGIKKKGGYFEKVPNGKKEEENYPVLSDLTEGITDDLVGKVFKCSKSDQPYTFTKQELDFYRKHNLPLPDVHPEERNKERFAKLPPLTPRTITCPGCKKKITTYYPESWGYKRIGCEECYLKTLY
ncbi:hypothetical protein JW758_00455 [Candidatus Peregrinibacteria bacterium]|nr:hypothetical protein [Candidatus Peregrinibacteria bacterium]